METLRRLLQRIGFRGRTAAAGATASSGRRLDLWTGLVLVAVCAIYATHVRLTALSAWESDPEHYVASGVPMMTTLDAYYALRLARLYAADKFVPHGPVPVRRYSRPEQGNPNDWYDQREPKDLPLLSGVIAVVSPLFGGDIDRTGLLLPALLSSLFMFPLFMCCWRLGMPAAGLMGGLVATLCTAYLQRSGVGWVRTDILNLFFPWTVTALILAMHGGQRRIALLLLSAAAGGALHAFHLWYGKPGLTLAFVLALAIHLALAGVGWRRVALCVATTVLFSGLSQFGAVLGSLENFGARYLWHTAAPVPEAASVRFADVWSTISEVRSLHWTETLRQILDSANLAAIGLVGFVVFALQRWRAMAALGPVVVLGVLALLSSRRFIFYLAPFVGIGWGFIVSLIVGRLSSRFGAEPNALAQKPEDGRSSRTLRITREALARPGVKVAICYLAVIGLYAGWFAPAPGRQIVPQPAISAPIFRDLQVLAKRLPADSRVWTWWDIGFAITDATPFTIYHDGAAQYTPQTNLIAASFVDRSPRVMHDIIRFVDREGNRGIRRLAASAGSFDAMLAAMRDSDQQLDSEHVYILYTLDMLTKYAPMRVLGLPPEGAGSVRRPSFGIRKLHCERAVEEKLECAEAKFDLVTGSLERTAPVRDSTVDAAKLRRAVIVQGGSVLRVKEYPGAAQLTVEIILDAGVVKAVYLLDEAAFESNLNQMFVLGRFDPSRFEETFADFPYARVFRVVTPRD